jgi:MarR family 2-MHQ and catechol resistance regulon transcriptional repressor
MPSHYRGPRREERALDAFIKLNRAVETLGAQLGRALAAHRLTEGQFAILEALLHLGAMNQRELGRKVLRSNANVCTVLENLEKGGLVRRERGADDRRIMNVSLTADGRALIERIFPPHAATIAEMLAILTDEEQEQLAALCKKLGTGIKRE